MNDDIRSLEQVYSSAVSGLYARLRNNYDFLYREFGQDGIKLIADMSREYGLSIAERAKNSIKNNDLDSVAGYLVRIFDTVGRRPGYAPVVQRSDNGYIIKIEQCPLHFENPELCLAHTTMEATVVKELNAGLSYRIGKSIPCGDAYCEHIVEIK